MLKENTRINVKRFFLFGFLAIVVFWSCEKDDPLSEEDRENIGISEWIYDYMDEVYYWNSTIARITDFTDKTDPEKFFYDLVYDEKDNWSYITDDFTSLEAELSGTPYSMGYSPSFGLIDENKVGIIVEYVYPNSPADIAGLERGDIIITIDGEYMGKDNYYDLFSQKSYTAGLGAMSTRGIISSNRFVDMTAEVINADPLIFDTTYEVSNKKIGYFVYTEFISGKTNEYLASIDDVLDNFANEGVTDLIIDLRYNPGGEGDVAAYLASALAPASVANGNNIFTTYEYNELYEEYFRVNEGNESENLITKFSNKTNSLELSSVNFLTTNGTASASELLIIGLEPYMDVKIIGESTYGKYTGMWVIYDIENEPREHDWCIMPVVMKYANSVGFTDFDDGLSPDIEVADNLLYAKPFGDTNDDLLSTAINSITGVSLRSAKTNQFEHRIQYQRLYNERRDYKRNVFIPHAKKR